MTLVFHRQTGEWECLSSEKKPKTLPDVPEPVPLGSILKETDTKKTFKFNGAEWVDQNPPPAPKPVVQVEEVTSQQGTYTQAASEEIE